MTQFDRNTVLSGGGEMGALMRSIDWSKTAVGPVERWPQSLRTALSILLETGFPMYIAWGESYTQFYNDGYRPILGSTKHPMAMGISTRETFAEIWTIIGPMFQGVMEGRPTTLVDFLLPLDRHGFTEECYFIFSYSPIREESGRVGGVLVTVTETTQRLLGERRLKTTQALAAETRDARTVKDACLIAGRVLAGNAADLPFARIYLIADDRREATLASACGVAPLAPDLPETIRLETGPFAGMMRPGRPQVLDISLGLDAAPTPASSTAGAGRLLALPITRQGADHPMGILVAGTSPRLMLDDGYRGFLSLVASQIGTAIAAAQALQEAQARAEALAELDRAKTAFFSNVSHEFRTPLTLMLGPTEEALASPERALRGTDLETVHRNERRLLKLVNTLLDFSRIEAGRVNARFEPTDLAALTTDLASAFRSATERAGLRLIVDCPPLPAPVYVDREMWEKIVLNLLSNAFKFTFQGSIAVELEPDGRARRASRAGHRHRHCRERSRPRLRQVPPHRTRRGAHARRVGHRPGARPRARHDPRRQPSAPRASPEKAPSSPFVFRSGRHILPPSTSRRSRTAAPPRLRREVLARHRTSKRRCDGSPPTRPRALTRRVPWRTLRLPGSWLPTTTRTCATT